MTDERCGLWLPGGAVLSHESAARLWDLPLPPSHDETVHVTVPMSRGRWRTTTEHVTLTRDG